LDNLNGLGHDLGANAISRNDSDALFGAHGMEDYQLGRRLSFRLMQDGRPRPSRHKVRAGTPVLKQWHCTPL
jgi:hypothetical protein